VLASVQVSTDGEILMLTATNLSAAGMFLEANPADYPQLWRGIFFEVMLSFATQADGGAPPSPLTVKARGRIVRIQPPGMATPAGFGVVLTDLEQGELQKLRSIIEQA
jgi:hypothetical protein